LVATGRIAGRLRILDKCEITFTQGVADSPLEKTLDCQFLCLPYLLCHAATSDPTIAVQLF
jgi:hypothetical protein